MVLLSFFPATLIRYFGVWEEAQNLAGQMFSAWFQARLIDAEFGKMLPICQINSPQGRVAHSSSRRQSTFLPLAPTKRFPSSRCASATKIGPPLESTVATQPRLKPDRRTVAVF